MSGVFASPWLGRGARLSLLVGLLAAAWDAWGWFDLYQQEQKRWFKTELMYKCAAALSPEILAPHITEFGTINVRSFCFTDDDAFVSLKELDEVRAGTMKFETSWKPFYWQNTAVVGLLWAFGTLFATLLALTAIAATRWVWGKSASD